MPPEITCRRVAVAEILPLRHRILRAGLPFETACFDGDDDESTRHYAAVSGLEPVCCLSLMPSEWEGRPAWQLRGMATDAAVQGRGLGRRLLETAVADARRDEPSRILWCNARTSAIGFYEKLGWRVMSKPFDVPAAGPHVKMLFKPPGEKPERTAGIEAAARPPMAAFIGAELAFLAAAHVLGGPPWVVLGVLAFAGQVAADFRLRPLVGLVPAGFWMAAHQYTGNRELFFPYAITLAAHLAGQVIGRGRVAAAVAGGLVVAAFLAIRVGQAATAKVLAVEAAVAAVILAAAVAGLPAAEKRPWGTVAVTAVASLLAYAGLAL
jgi:predicted GNAT family N-acyltransferase